MAIASTSYGKEEINQYPFINIYNEYDPIPFYAGASRAEADMLLTLATAEMAGMLNVEEACIKWGCDDGYSYSVWQIQCIDRPGRSWNDNRWLWYLREKLSLPKLTCNDLNINVIAAKAALTILRSFKKDTTINTMMKWGKSPNPQRRILLLQSIHNRIVKHRTS
jgi:hypothetical protein